MEDADDVVVSEEADDDVASVLIDSEEMSFVNSGFTQCEVVFSFSKKVNFKTYTLFVNNKLNTNKLFFTKIKRKAYEMSNGHALRVDILLIKILV